MALRPSHALVLATALVVGASETQATASTPGGPEPDPSREPRVVFKVREGVPEKDAAQIVTDRLARGVARGTAPRGPRHVFAGGGRPQSTPGVGPPDSIGCTSWICRTAKGCTTRSRSWPATRASSTPSPTSSVRATCFPTTPARPATRSSRPPGAGASRTGTNGRFRSSTSSTPGSSRMAGWWWPSSTPGSTTTIRSCPAGCGRTPRRPARGPATGIPGTRWAGTSSRTTTTRWTSSGTARTWPASSRRRPTTGSESRAWLPPRASWPSGRSAARERGRAPRSRPGSSTRPTTGRG